MFEYMTAREAAELWSISVRRVQKLCKEDRIKGVLNLSRVWLIPKDTEKPVDARFKTYREEKFVDGNIDKRKDSSSDEKDFNNRC